jgi:hypothetical protein
MNDLPLTHELFDTLRSLSLKRRQGVLEVVCAKSEYELTFFDGKIIHADRLEHPFIDYLAEELGTEFSRSKELSTVGRGEQIAKLLQLTGLGFDKLAELKKGYDRQTLHCLSSESHFSFDFRTKIVRCPDGLGLDLSPGHYMLDILERRLEPQVLTRVRVESGAEITPEISPQVLPPVTLLESESKTAPRRKKKMGGKKRPPKVGRFKSSPSSQRRGGGRIGPGQVLMCFKLCLILVLVMAGPGFIQNWVSILGGFLNVR